MRYALKIFTWFRIPVFVHWSFGLIIALVAYQVFTKNASVLDFFIVLTYVLAVFLCVLLHEFGHALAARRYKVETRDIILTPIGGIARLEGMPKKASEELVVAIAGPLVNVAIVILLSILSFFLFDMAELTAMFQYVGSAFAELFSDSKNIVSEEMIETSIALEIITTMITVNAFLFAFNLIPAFPMDGGRIFRALLEMGSNKLTATRIAAFLGQVIAMGFIVIGLQNEPHTLALIGVFIFFAARSEYKSLVFQEKLGDIKVEQFMGTEFIKFYSEHSLGELRRLIGSLDKPRMILLLNSTNDPMGFTTSVIIREELKRRPHLDDEAHLYRFMHGIAGYLRPEETLKEIQSAFPVEGLDKLFLVRERDAWEISGYVTSKHVRFVEQGNFKSGDWV